MIFATTFALLLSLGADIGSDGPPGYVQVYVRTVDESAVDSPFEYALKPGRPVHGTLWGTEQPMGSGTITFDYAPPAAWNKVEGIDFVDVKHDSIEQTIFVRSEGFELKSLVVPGATAQEGPAVLPLERVESITGRVVGPDGEGVSDAPILIGRLPIGIGGWDTAGAAVCFTDGAGQFVLKTYPANMPFLITTHTPTYACGYMYIDKPDPSTIYEIRLCGSASLAGTVVLSRGSIKSAVVWIDVLTSKGEPYVTYIADANRATGEFLVRDLPPGEARLSTYVFIPAFFFWEKNFSHHVAVQLECGKTKSLEISVDTR
ncbi:MAG: hypothetical protein KF886_03245 [Candidatus Hydrogenedentes bacterium]|nr:hypothetical protein [Candidatus Hydrogenedentota bacterium]